MNENKKVLDVDIDNLEYIDGDGVEYVKIKQRVKNMRLI